VLTKNFGFGSITGDGVISNLVGSTSASAPADVSTAWFWLMVSFVVRAVVRIDSAAIHPTKAIAAAMPTIAQIGAEPLRRMVSSVFRRSPPGKLTTLPWQCFTARVEPQRLQLGISRVSPEQAIDGWRYFGYAPPDGMTDADIARRHTDVLLEVPRGEGIAQPNPRPIFPNSPGLLRIEP
jgi:hypothetical protein